MSEEIQRHRVCGSPVEVGYEIQRLVQAGWEIDEWNPLSSVGQGFMECGFTRDPAHDNDGAPKMTRAEILTKARAAKAEKAKANE